MTRAEPQAAPLIDAIGQHGGIAIALPLLKIVDAEDGGVELADALERLEARDWLVVLSPNGARRIIERYREPSVGRPRLAVIGSGTESIFADVGFAADLIPEVASSVGLLEAFSKIAIDSRVLIAQAQNGRAELREGLAERGIDVETVAAYRNLMPAIGSCLLYTSPSPRDKRQSRMPSSA